MPLMPAPTSPAKVACPAPASGDVLDVIFPIGKVRGKELDFFFFFVAHRGEVRIEDCPESERGHHPAWLAKRNDDDDDDDDYKVKDEDWGSRSPGRLRRTRVPPPKGRRGTRCFRRK